MRKKVITLQNILGLVTLLGGLTLLLLGYGINLLSWTGKWGLPAVGIATIIYVVRNFMKK